HTRQTWMPGAAGKRSPSRKISELSGRLICEAPLEQSAVPVAFAVTELMTHTLVAVLPGFGIGSGGPNRHPTLVQFRLVAPGSVDLMLVRVSAGPVPWWWLSRRVPWWWSWRRVPWWWWSWGPAGRGSASSCPGPHLARLGRYTARG